MSTDALPTSDASEVVRVLHVDDEPDFAELTATLLERDGLFRVETAPGADEALDRLAESEFDCVVSDYEMPGRNGIEFLGEVREIHPELPFVLFTGKGSEEVASEAISAGVTDYLQKGSGSEQFGVLANRIRNAVERYRARKAAERSRRNLERTYERITDGFCAIDTDWRYTYVNREGARMFDRPRDDLVGAVVWEVFPELVGTPFEDALRTAMETQGTTSVEEYYPPHDTWYFVRVYPDQNGISVFFQDVTDRKERETKIDRLRTRAQTLMYADTKTKTARIATEAADEIIGAPLSGFHQLNDAGDALEPSAAGTAVYEAFGEAPRYPRDAPAGSRAAIVWRVFDNDESLAIADTREYECLTEDTPARSVIIHAVGNHGVFVVSSDEPHAFDDTDEMLVEILTTFLTTALDRVERERQLRDSQTRLERLHTATRDLMLAETQRAIAERAVAAAEDILEFPLAVVRAYDSAADGLVPIASTDSVAEVIPDRPVFTPDDGSINWAAYESGEPKVFDDVGAVERAVDSDTDLGSLLVLPLGSHGTLSAGDTEKGAFDDSDVFFARILATATEAALDRSDREERLRRQRDELERRNERLDEFASIVSHDLRNPLNVARGRLELARKDCESDHHDGIAEAHERMRALIDDLLALAREGDTAIDPEPVELATQVEECWDTAGTTGAAIEVETDRTVRADRNRLAQLLENLLENAIEHGGEAVTVTVGELPDGFFLEDDGSGIPPDDREDVFEAGYSSASDRTGFGLRIVEQLADAHDWEVSVTEGRNGGARFDITGVEFVE